ncbi:hypothetical protein EMCRGX_G028269 [Ephydatia muelleri]
MKDLLVKFNECGDAFLERLRSLADGKTEVSMKEALHETTLDVISKVIQEILRMYPLAARIYINIFNL